MSTVLEDNVFSEARGRPQNLVHFAGALVFTSLYVYVWTVGDTAPGAWLLVMAAATAVAGVAESLPKSRRRTTGVLRLVGIVTLLCLIAVVFVAPEAMLG
jgi:peptidoglycan/LPS O-acetylase OafA/YrhL